MKIFVDEAGQNIFASERRIGAEEIVDAVAVSEHANNLMHRDASPGDAGLPVADSWLNRNSFIHAGNVSENPPGLKRALKTANDQSSAAAERGAVAAQVARRKRPRT